MYLLWRPYPLSAKGCRPVRHPCPHPVEGPGRKRLEPIVCASLRVEGRPRYRIVHRLPSLRACCVADAGAAVARSRWWAGVDASWSKAPAEVRALRPMLEAQLAARVPRPGEAAVVPLSLQERAILEQRRRAEARAAAAPAEPAPVDLHQENLVAAPAEPAPSSQDAHAPTLPAPPAPEVAPVEGEATEGDSRAPEPPAGSDFPNLTKTGDSRAPEPPFACPPPPPPAPVEPPVEVPAVAVEPAVEPPAVAEVSSVTASAPPAPPTDRVEVPAEVDAPVAPALPPCFEVLGLGWPCSAADVRAAWRTAATRGGPAGFVAANRAKAEAEAWLRAHG